MIRQPMHRRSTARGLQTSRTASLLAPVAGWNARDPIASMKPKYAVVMENWFPRENTIELRPGVVSHTTGFVSQPLAFLAWNGFASSPKLFAATATNIYDVTASGALGASVTACTNAYWLYKNFTVAGGHYLVAVNGVDKLKLYNGTTWTDVDGVSVPAITGLATTSLSHVAVLHSRLWFVQKDSLSAWYLPVGQVGGALTEFPLGQVFPRGGKLVAIESWTIDGGNGSDDYSVFVSSEGEVAVYSGTDPASASTWRKVGTYYIGKPIGKKCLCKYGGDLLILTVVGLFPLSKALLSSTIDRREALTDAIDTAFLRATSLYTANTGWEVVYFPQAGLLLINVPITSGYVEQFAYNTVTGAWSKFVGWLANSFEVFDGKLFLATTDRTGQAWSGRNDFGASIVGRVLQAYSTFGNAGRQKHFKLIRPLIAVDGNITLQLGIDVDYDDGHFSSAVTEAPVLGYLWDTAIWDSVSWGYDMALSRDWLTIFSKECFAAALRLQVSTTSVTLKWSATDFVYEVGGVL